MTGHVYKHLANVELFCMKTLFPEREADKPAPPVVLAMKIPAPETERRDDE